ncbi:MAG: maleate isomerase [Gammaproteobacteria bacterium]|jgi:maleate isomerase
MTRHFGVLIPSTNTTVEIEYNRLLPESLQVHVGRLGKDGKSPFAPSLKEDIDYQAKMLGTANVEVVSLAQTSASLFEANYDEQTKARISAAAGAPAITSAQAIGMALGALGVQRIALVSPYSEAVIALAKDYYQTHYGLSVLAMEGFAAEDAYAIGAIGPEHATAAFKRIDNAEIEALVVPGGNFPTMKYINDWEAQLGKPVITTNQAGLWALLDVMQIRTPLAGLGQLLAKMPASIAAQ